MSYNLGKFLRRLVSPEAAKDLSLKSLQVKLTKIGGWLVRHTRRLVFQLAEVAVPGGLQCCTGVHQESLFRARMQFNVYWCGWGGLRGGVRQNQVTTWRRG